MGRGRELSPDMRRAVGVVAVAVLCGAAGSVGVLTWPWPWAVELALGAAALAVLTVIGVRLAAWACGPVFRHELVRGARRGGLFWHRGLYAAVLLVLLAVQFRAMHPERNGSDAGPGPGMSAHEAPAFAHSFFETILIGQLLGALFVTPLYCAGVLADERHRGTLDLMRTTDLSDREIVLGLGGARLATLLLLALTVVPVLAFLFVLGGVDVGQLSLGVAVAGATAVASAAASAYESARSPTPVRAVMRTLGVILAFTIATLVVPCVWWLNPVMAFSVAMWQGFQPRPFVLVLFFCAQAVIGLCYGISAVRVLRAGGTPSPRPARRKSRPSTRPAAAASVPPPADSGPRRAAAWRDDPLPKLGERPLWWKEWAVERPLFPRGAPAGYFLRGCLIVAAVGWLVPLLVIPAVRSGEIDFAVAFVASVGAAIATAPRISRERERRTLDGLLTLPVSDEVLLGAKWLAGVLPWSLALVLAVFGWGVLALSGRLPGLAVPLLLMAALVYVSVGGCLGLWLSAVCRTTPRAILLAGVLTAALMLGPACVMAEPGPAVGWRLGWVEQFIYYGMSPRMALKSLAGSAGLRPYGPRRLANEVGEPGSGAAVAGVALFAGMAALLWVDTRRRLRR